MSDRRENLILLAVVMSFEIAILFICVTLALVYKYLSWYFNYWKKQGVRGPKPRILYGNFEKSHRGKCNIVDEMHDIYLKYKSSERFVGVFAARRPQLFVLDPALAVQILTTNFSNFRTNEASKWTTPKLDRLRYTSPMVLTGNIWTETRAEIVPALSVARLRSFHPVMTKTANKLSDFIKTYTGAFDIKDVFLKFTVEFMSDFIWGITANSLGNDKRSHIYELADDMIRQANKCAGYYQNTQAWPWLRKLRPVRFFSESTDLFLTRILTEASKLRSENPSNRQDVLNHLLQLHGKQQLPEIKMAGHATTVFLNGFKIAGTTIDHCMLMLARNQKAQSKLRREILENCDDSGTLNFNRLLDLPYLDQCVHETIRIFPPVALFSKLCTSPVELENLDGSKVQLKPGDSIYISAYSFHHDEDIFEKAEEFIPERFDPEVGGTQSYRKMGAFLPFGGGPRICLGMKLGLVEVKIAVVEIVRKFEIYLAPPTRDDNQLDPTTVLLYLKGGIHLKFNPIT